MKQFIAILMLFLLVGCADDMTDALSDAIQTEIETGTGTGTGTGTESMADADVTFVRAVLGTSGTWTFHVTVLHPDTGWDDYADGWDVVLPDGTVLLRDPDDPFTRLLLHPHETEQPFTRSQSGLTVPDDVTTVTVQAHETVHGFGGAVVVVDLTAESGEKFVVERP